MFFDEGVEIMRALEREILGWSEAPANPQHARNLLESLHTLKGGAQLCGLMEVGDLAHRFETHLSAMQERRAQPDAAAFRQLRARKDRLEQALDLARAAGDRDDAPHQEPRPATKVPFSGLLPRLETVIGRLQEELCKPVALHCRHAQVELDAGVLKRLAMPLEHLLRNAVDHGIETPRQRRRRGKPEIGQIDIVLAVRDGAVLIEVADDGAGIDVGHVRQSAQAGGFLAMDAELADAAAAELVFAPGVSTARAVSRTSGRGVGLSAARAGVERLGGRIEVSSRLGQGTSFVIRIPYGP